MAGISAGGGGGGKKPVDHEVPLIPFIDLLLCCVMFLLATAVWSELSRVSANQQQPGDGEVEEEIEDNDVKLVLQVLSTGYVLADTTGAKEEIAKRDDTFDLVQLKAKLVERRALGGSEADRTKIIVAPEDGVLYNDVVQAMDMVVGQGYVDMSLSDGASL